MGVCLDNLAGSYRQHLYENGGCNLLSGLFFVRGRAPFLLLALIVALMVPGAFAFGQGDGGPEFRSEDVVRSTVRVVAYDEADRPIGWGAGWIISTKDDVNRAGNAIVATTFHTLSKAHHVRVFSSDGTPLAARIRSVKRETRLDYDLAFLEVKDLDDPALTIAEQLPDSGRPVYALGYSDVADKSEVAQWAKKASLQSGTLSKAFAGGMTRASQAPVDQIEHNAPLADGYSGGPLIDRCGRVIGVNTTDGGHLKLGAAAATSVGSNFALSSNELISVAAQEGVPVERTPGGPCAVAPPIQASADTPAAPVAKESTLQRIGDYFRSHPLYLGAVVIVALAALALGIWLLISGQRQTLVSGPVISGGGPPPIAPPSPAADSSPVIELSGRGPDGEVLNFRFTADELANGSVKIGADPDVAARIDRRTDYKVSSTHAALAYDGRNFTIEDLKSTNKTKISGSPLTPHKPRALMQGDELELADVKLRVNIH